MAWRLSALIRLQIYLKLSDADKKFINITCCSGVGGAK